MSDTIKRIVEDATFKAGSYNSSKEGYLIETEKHTIKIGIDDFQSCCEDWGYCHSDDVLEDFVGSEFISVQVTDTALSKMDVPKMYEGDVMFVDINTNKGTFQIALYNEHNGYYGHEAVVLINEEIDYQEYL